MVIILIARDTPDGAYTRTDQQAKATEKRCAA